MAKHKDPKERILDQLRDVKIFYDKANRHHSPIRDSCQNLYNNTKRRLAKE